MSVDAKWMETFSGRKFYPLSPDPESVVLVDIAHALSMICRFTGHCQRFYSVGQHSINVAREMARHGYPPLVQLYGLLHDGSEAYIADINRPAKQQLPDYKVMEKAVQSAVYQAFALPEPDEETHGIVKYFDNEMLKNEARNLMRCKEWDLGEFEVFPQADFSEHVPLDIAYEFAELFTQLYGWIRDDLEKQYIASQSDNESSDSTKTD